MGVHHLLALCFLLLTLPHINRIISVVTLTVTVLTDGIIASGQPGSLRHPMPTSVGPQWRMLPISFGLIMSGVSTESSVSRPAAILLLITLHIVRRPCCLSLPCSRYKEPSGLQQGLQSGLLSSDGLLSDDGNRWLSNVSCLLSLTMCT